MRNLYTILGIDKSADQAEVKRAYRALAKKYHPDLNTDDAEAEKRFKEASAAFEILGDEKKRGQYDRGEIDEHGARRIDPGQFRSHYANRGPQRQYRAWSPEGGFDEAHGEINLDEILSDLFGGGRPGGSGGPGGGPFGGAHRGGGGFSGFPGTREQPRPGGEDVHYTLNVDFLEAAKGARKKVTMPDGKSLHVNIPAGIDDGQKLRLKGKGRPGMPGGEAGDAIVTVKTGTHRHFSREGRDLRLTLPISIDEAVLGAKIAVPTLSGTVNLTVPPGADSGQKMRLKGKGIKPARGAAGDLIVELKIMTPDKPDDALKKQVESWAKKHAYGAALRRHLK